MIFKLKVTPDQHDRLEGDSTATAMDLSGGGVSFCVDRVYEIGQILELTFSLEGLPGEINSLGRVMRCWNDAGANYAAVEFVTIDQNDRIIILDFIQTYLVEKGEA